METLSVKDNNMLEAENAFCQSPSVQARVGKLSKSAFQFVLKEKSKVFEPVRYEAVHAAFYDI